MGIWAGEKYKRYVGAALAAARFLKSPTSGARTEALQCSQPAGKFWMHRYPSLGNHGVGGLCALSMEGNGQAAQRVRSLMQKSWKTCNNPCRCSPDR